MRLKVMGGSGGSEAVKSLINLKSYEKKKKKKNFF